MLLLPKAVAAQVNRHGWGCTLLGGNVGLLQASLAGAPAPTVIVGEVPVTLDSVAVRATASALARVRVTLPLEIPLANATLVG